MARPGATLNDGRVRQRFIFYTQKNHYFLAYPKKFLNSFFATPKNPSYFVATQKTPGVLHKPKKITFGQNFRPKKITRSPPSLEYVSGAPGVARNSFLARAACAAEVLPLNHGRCTQYSNLTWNTPVCCARERTRLAHAQITILYSRNLWKI